MIKLIFGSEINHDFSEIYLGKIPTKLSRLEKHVLQIVLAGSKKAITRKWMIKEPPTRTEWMRIVNEIPGMVRNVILPEMFYGYICQLLDTIIQQGTNKNFVLCDPVHTSIYILLFLCIGHTDLFIYIIFAEY